jgi:ABC-type transport system involved in cytochrome c biogenesis ATPase subunit
MASIRLKEIRISNYRSIKEEQILLLGGEATLIGPNNSGKTNALRAIYTLFGGYENSFGYNIESDLPFDRQSKKTSLIGLFEIDDSESWFWESLDKLHQLQGTERNGNEVLLYLYFTGTNTPVYSFFANAKRPQDKKADYSRILRSLISEFVSRFQVVYIPSEKGITELYSQLLAPRVSQKAAAILSTALPSLENELRQINAFINKTLQDSGISRAEVQIEVPGGKLANIIGQFGLAVTDEVKTSYMSKGRGLQAAIFYASLHWVDERIKESGQHPVWLIEEPESYMHPELAKHSKDMVRKLAQKSIAVISTHSMQFMPRSTEGIHEFSTENGATQVNRFIKYEDACNSLKRSLGLRFSDYYSLADCNVFVEGKWDAYIIRECLPAVKKLTGLDLKCLENALIIDKGGVSGLAGFLRATYSHIRKEVAAVTVIDGDEAGVRIRKELQGFFSQRGEFQANRDYISVRTGYEMEGIFPDAWIIECHNANPGWFGPWSLDSMNNVEPFSVQDDKKQNYAKYMHAKLLEVSSYAQAPEDLKGRLFNLFVVLEKALQTQLDGLSSKSPNNG